MPTASPSSFTISAPIPGSALFLGKAFANYILVLAVELIALPLKLTTADDIAAAYRRLTAEAALHLGDVRVEESRKLHGLLRRLADKAGCSGDSVREHVRSEPP